MYDIFCRCPRCGGSLIIDFDATTLAYYKDYTAQAILYQSQEPPNLPDFVVMKCAQGGTCEFVNEFTHKEVLEMMAEYWGKIAWSFALSDHLNAFQFEDKFTRFIAFKGYDKMVTHTELNHKQVLKEFYDYCEKEHPEESDD